MLFEQWTDGKNNIPGLLYPQTFFQDIFVLFSQSKNNEHIEKWIHSACNNGIIIIGIIVYQGQITGSSALW